MQRKLLTIGFVLGALTACAGGGGSSDAADNGDASTTTAATIPAAASGIVVNEFNAVGAVEWLELGNSGTAAFDLSGYGLADSDKDTGAPKTSDKLTFPAGTTIGAGGKLLVVVSKKDATAGPHPSSECGVTGGPDTCLMATWGISASNGEQVHFLGPSNEAITSTAYPRNLGIDSANGQTACRLPDLTGELATCKATPGATNAGP